MKRRRMWVRRALFAVYDAARRLRQRGRKQGILLVPMVGVAKSIWDCNFFYDEAYAVVSATDCCRRKGPGASLQLARTVGNCAAPYRRRQVLKATLACVPPFSKY
jgi:hypothetical protein